MSQFGYLISLMTWSYSRLRAYEDCGYGFFLKYIQEEKECEHFYSEYGSLMHRILERFYSGKITKEQALNEFMSGFVLRVPQEVKPNVSESWYEQGKKYLSSLAMPEEKIAGIEEKLDFKIGGYPFIGYVDLLLEDGGLIIEDHKSRILQAKSYVKNIKTEQKNNEEFDRFAKQLYIYSAGIEQKYGELPKEIRFNCFRSGEVLTEKFDKEKYEEAKAWAINTIRRIEQESEWEPAPDWFRCKYICGLTETCDIAQLL